MRVVSMFSFAFDAVTQSFGDQQHLLLSCLCSLVKSDWLTNCLPSVTGHGEGSPIHRCPLTPFLPHSLLPLHTRSPAIQPIDWSSAASLIRGSPW